VIAPPLTAERERANAADAKAAETNATLTAERERANGNAADASLIAQSTAMRHHNLRKLLDMPRLLIAAPELSSGEQARLTEQLSAAAHIQLTALVDVSVDVLIRPNAPIGDRPLFVDASRLSESYAVATRLGIITTSLGGFLAALRDMGLAPAPHSGNASPRKKVKPAKSGQLAVTGGLLPEQRHIGHDSGERSSPAKSLRFGQETDHNDNGATSKESDDDAVGHQGRSMNGDRPPTVTVID
jgi:hypothetical protein